MRYVDDEATIEEYIQNSSNRLDDIQSITDRFT